MRVCTLLQDVLILIQDLQKSPNLRQLGVESVKVRFARPPWPADPIEQRKYKKTCKGIWKRIVLSLEQLTWIGQIEIHNPIGRSFRRWHSSSHICMQQGIHCSILLSICAKGLAGANEPESESEKPSQSICGKYGITYRAARISAVWPCMSVQCFTHMHAHLISKTKEEILCSSFTTMPVQGGRNGL